MRAVFVAPELRQAMLMLLCCEGPLKKRRRFGRNFRVIVVIRTVMKSFAVGCRGRPGGRIDVNECFFCYTADGRRGKYKNCDDEGLTQFRKLGWGDESFQPYEIRGMSWPKSMGHKPEQTSLFTLKSTTTTIDTLLISYYLSPLFQ